jgi:hypothetical protein
MLEAEPHVSMLHEEMSAMDGPVVRTAEGDEVCASFWPPLERGRM